MTNNSNQEDKNRSYKISRRNVLKFLTSAFVTSTLMPLPGFSNSLSEQLSTPKETLRKPKAFVYTELQISIPFDQVPWQELNHEIKKQPGLINKTWLAGLGNNSVGGIYSFDSIENAQKFVTGYFPKEARKFGVAQTARIFDALIVEEACKDINSAHFGATLSQKPGAFVYTEVQLNVPFNKAPWRERNPVLIKQKGLIGKTWLSGLHTNTIGGIDVFDTIKNAKNFALNDFPKTASKLNAAFYTRIFDASITEQASKQMHSPFYL